MEIIGRIKKRIPAKSLMEIIGLIKKRLLSGHLLVETDSGPMCIVYLRPAAVGDQIKIYIGEDGRVIPLGIIPPAAKSEIS